MGEKYQWTWWKIGSHMTEAFLAEKPNVSNQKPEMVPFSDFKWAYDGLKCRNGEHT